MHLLFNTRVKPQYNNFGGGDFCWPCDGNKTSGYGNLLFIVFGNVGNNAATDITIQFPTPPHGFLPVAASSA